MTDLNNNTKSNVLELAQLENLWAMSEGEESKEVSLRAPTGKYKGHVSAIEPELKEPTAKKPYSSFMFRFKVSALEPIEGQKYLDDDDNEIDFADVKEMLAGANPSFFLFLAHPEDEAAPESKRKADRQNAKAFIQKATDLPQDAANSANVFNMMTSLMDEAITFDMISQTSATDASKKFTVIDRDTIRVIDESNSGSSTLDL